LTFNSKTGCTKELNTGAHSSVQALRPIGAEPRAQRTDRRRTEDKEEPTGTIPVSLKATRKQQPHRSSPLSRLTVSLIVPPKIAPAKGLEELIGLCLRSHHQEAVLNLCSAFIPIPLQRLSSDVCVKKN